MNMSLKYLFFAATMVFASSCSNELYNEGNESGNEIVSGAFSASQEQLASDGEFFESTRTALSAAESGASINWVVGDAINIFDGTSSCQFKVSTVGEDQTTCTFSAEKAGTSNNATKYVGLYPYSMSATYSESENKITGVTLPANQLATANGFDPKCNLMVANVGKGEKLMFKHLCGYIKVKPTVDCSRILITFNDTNVKPTGTFDVTWDESQNPKIGEVNNSNANVVRLLGEIKADQEYYIAILSGDYSGGFKVSYEVANTKDMIHYKEDHVTGYVTNSPLVRKTNNTLNINRAKIRSFGELNATNYKSEGEEKINFVDFNGYYDVVSDNNATVTDSIILWAKTNIGTKEEKEPGIYFAWGEVKGKDTYTSETYLCKDYYPLELDQAHDAASVNLGEGWRMPSTDELEKLKEQNIFVYTAEGYYVYPGEEKDGVRYRNLQYTYNKETLGVYRVQSGMDGNTTSYDEKTPEGKYVMDLVNRVNKPANYIFLPFGGYKSDNGLSKEGNQGFYWTNGHGEDDLWTQNNELTAYYLGIGSIGDRFNMKSSAKSRYYGFNVRPVFVVKGTENTSK